MKTAIRYYQRFQQIGFKGAVFGSAEKLRNKILFKFFKFDSWHIGATYHFRPYKKQVISIVNGISADVVIEIGCGLGDVISRVKAKKNIGVDLDKNVINAAIYLNKRTDCIFQVGELATLDLNRQFPSTSND